MPKIPCPSCREPNFDTDIVCWKCGKPLDRSAPDASPARMQVADARQWDVSVPGKFVVPDRRTTLVAAIIGGVVGAVVSYLVHIPFIRFADAASLPGMLTLPYLVFVTLAGAAAGVVAVSVRHGWLIGALAYLAGGYLFGVLVHGSGSAILMPLETPYGWGRMHTIGIGAGVITTASVLVTLAVVRLAGMRGLFPGLLPLPFINILIGWKMRQLAALMYATDENGNPAIMRLVAGLVLVMGLELFFLVGGRELIRKDQIRVVQGSPVTMVARYAWMASQPSPDPRTLSIFLTSDLSKRVEGSSSMQAAIRIPLASFDQSARNRARGVFIDEKHAVREILSADGQSAAVLLPMDPASGAVSVVEGAVPKGAQLVLFRVHLEDGKWRIADVPVVKGVAQ